MHQFACNISKVASLSKRWAQFFNDKTQSELKEVERNIESLIVDKPMGSLSSSEVESLGRILKKHQNLLAVEETKWCLKSRASMD
jgi:hypothetical protein